MASNHGVASHADEIALLIGCQTYAKMMGRSIRNFHRLRSKGLVLKPLAAFAQPRWIRAEVTAWIMAGCPHPSAWRWNGGNT